MLDQFGLRANADKAMSTWDLWRSRACLDRHCSFPMLLVQLVEEIVFAQFSRLGLGKDRCRLVAVLAEHVAVHDVHRHPDVQVHGVLEKHAALKKRLRPHAACYVAIPQKPQSEAWRIIIGSILQNTVWRAKRI